MSEERWKAEFNRVSDLADRQNATNTRLTESLVDAHQALDAARRSARAWKELAKFYRGEAKQRRSACKLALRVCEEFGALADELHAIAETAKEEERFIPARPGEGERQARGALRDLRGRLRVAAYRAERAEAVRVFCASPASAQVSSAASGFPGRSDQACKETRNMSENNEIRVGAAGGAEGVTLNTGERTQANSAAPGRFPKTACHKLANGASASAGPEDGSGGSSVQCERNGSGVQGCPVGSCPGRMVRERSSDGSCDERERCNVCGVSYWLNEPTTGSDAKLIPFAQALDAARSWARDWLDVYGQPSALWALLMRFAALVAMRPGERRRLDEHHTFRLFEAEPGGILEAGQLTAGIVLPFGAERFGRPLGEREAAELEALVRGAMQRVEALHAEAELFRHAAGLLRNQPENPHGAPIGGWHPGAVDFLNDWGTVLDGPHPDAVSFSLLGSLLQAWAERGGAGPVPVVYLARLAWQLEPEVRPVRGMTRDTLSGVLRDVNHSPHFSRDRALNALIGAALAADAEAESEVL